ncbi:MAG: hypothetical protein AAF362_12995 [Pseudomonadota bacterium]
MNQLSGRFGATNPEIGGIVHLDHVNFETPDHEMATIFYINGLGLTRDPYRRADEQNMGINVGLQQFHLPRRGEQTPPFHGVVGLVVPEIAGIKKRLDLLEELGKFKGTPYHWEEQNKSVLLTSPFGVQFQLHQADTIPFLRPLGIAYVDISVPPDTADGIAKFYVQIARAPVDVIDAEGSKSAVISAGPFQQIRFVERDQADYSTHSMHISYHATNYNELRESVAAHGSLMGAGQGEVFFFDKLFDPDTGDVIFTINNEVRSIYHPDFMRPLVNRWPLVDEPFTDQTEAMKALVENIGFVPGAGN